MRAMTVILTNKTPEHAQYPYLNQEGFLQFRNLRKLILLLIEELSVLFT